MFSSSASKESGSRAQPSKTNCGIAGGFGSITPDSSEAISSSRCFRSVDATWTLAITSLTVSPSSPDCPYMGLLSEQSLSASHHSPMTLGYESLPEPTCHPPVCRHPVRLYPEGSALGNCMEASGRPWQTMVKPAGELR